MAAELVLLQAERLRYAAKQHNATQHNSLAAPSQTHQTYHVAYPPARRLGCGVALQTTVARRS